MNEGSVWTCTVGELMALFVESLRAVAPVASRAYVAWQDGAAYDEWDSISASLFDAFVSTAILAADPPQNFLNLKIPEYEHEPKSGTNAYIEVTSASDERISGIFVRFGSARIACDTVVVKTSTGRRVEVPETDARFRLRLDTGEAVERLTIPL